MNIEFAQILDTISVGVFMVDREWRCVYANDEVARLVHKERESLVGKVIWEEFPDPLPAVFDRKCREAAERQQPLRFDAHFDPLKTWCDVRVQPWPAGIVIQLQDITQRRNEADQLRFQNEILSQITNAVIKTDAEGIITYWNRSAERISGYPASEALGHRLRELIPYEWPSESSRQAARNALLTTGMWKGEIRHQRRDGSPILVDVIVRQLTDEGGAAAGRLAVIRDLSRRRQIEDELEARVRQQAIIGELSRRALSGTDLDRIFAEATQSLTSALTVDYAKILQLLPGRNAFRLRAGAGWDPGLVGNAIVEGGTNSQAGFTLLSRQPVIVEDLRAETRFSGPALLTDHDVVSGMSVVIGNLENPFGVLGVHSRTTRHFSQDDVHCLQAVAGILATTIERRKVEVALRASEASLRQQAQIIDQIHDAVVSTDLDGVIKSWNKGAERLLGYRVDEVLNQHISILYSENDRDFLRREIIETLKEKGTHDVEVRMISKRGEDVFAHLSLSTLRNENGAAVGLIGYSLDITDRVRADAERQELLAREQAAIQAAENAAEAARRLHVVTDSKLAHLALDDLLGRLLDSIRDLLAVDTLAILLETGDGKHLKVRVARGIEEVDLENNFQSTIGEGMSGRIVSSGQPMVIDDVSVSDVRSPLLRARVRSAAGVPLFVEDRAIGVLRAGSVNFRHFTSDDLRLLQIVADRLALAIDRSRLAEAEWAARTEANASTLLAASLDYELTLKDLASSAVPDLADWCSIFIRDGSGPIQMIALAVADPSEEVFAERFEQRFSLDLERNVGVPQVFRTGQPEIIRSMSDERQRIRAQTTEELQMLRSANLASVINVPLRALGEVIGVMSFASTDASRRFGESDLVLMQDLAKRASLAIENGRLYRASQSAIRRAEQQAEQLRQLTAASLMINSGLSLDEVLQAITDEARSIIGANMAVTSLTLGKDWAQAITATSLAEQYARWREWEAQTDGSGIYHVVCETNQPMRLTQAELEAHPAYRGFGSYAAKHPPLNGWLAVPLVDRDGHNIGLIQLSDKANGEFSEGDEQIIRQLAQIAAIAVENAHLYDEVQRALSVRDQFLSMASHELKTPLTTVKGYVQLLNRYLHRPEMDRSHLEESVQELQHQVRRLEVLLNDLLDSSRIQQGRLSLRPGPMDLSNLARQVLTRFEQATERRTNHTLLLDAPSPVEGVWDYDRLDQIFSNLMSNALKYSPKGGEVRLAVASDGKDAVIRVSDQGIGMSPQEQQRLFEPFSRGERARRTADGTGLGLYITKQMIEQHGGTITVETKPGLGTTFTLRLPRNTDLT